MEFLPEWPFLCVWGGNIEEISSQMSSVSMSSCWLQHPSSSEEALQKKIDFQSFWDERGKEEGGGVLGFCTYLWRFEDCFFTKEYLLVAVRRGPGREVGPVQVYARPRTTRVPNIYLLQLLGIHKWKLRVELQLQLYF